MSARRRRWQLVLAALWLLDAALQYQPFMFSPAFATQTLAVAGQDNPAPVAVPLSWAAGLVAAHPIAANAVFATVQLLLALGLAWRRTATAALAGSIGWSLSVWWLGEGLGGVLTGSADPLTGAPGAVLLYALAALLLWPRPARTQAPPGGWSVATTGVLGASGARLLWLVLWGCLAYLALQPAVRAADAPAAAIGGLAPGEPGLLKGLDRQLAGILTGAGGCFAIASAVLLAIIALGVYTPPALTRPVLALAVSVAAFYCVAGQNFGGIATGTATDPNSGPLLALLAALYWPHPTAGPGPTSRGHPTLS